MTLLFGKSMRKCLRSNFVKHVASIHNIRSNTRRKNKNTKKKPQVIKYKKIKERHNILYENTCGRKLREHDTKSLYFEFLQYTKNNKQISLSHTLLQFHTLIFEIIKCISWIGTREKSYKEKSWREHFTLIERRLTTCFLTRWKINGGWRRVIHRYQISKFPLKNLLLYDDILVYFLLNN